MEWNLDQLRAFTLVAQTGSFTEAARLMGKVQSAVSTQVALLEADVGLDLFDRSRKKPSLTKAGEILSHEAVEILRQCEGFQERALAMAGRADEVELKIAVDEGLPFYTMPTVFENLARRYPHVMVQFAKLATYEVHNLVETGEVDVAIAFERSIAHSLDVEVRKLAEVRQVVVASSDHPLSALKRITRNDLAKHRQVILRSSQPDGSNSPEVSPRRWVSNTSFSAVNLVLQHVGWAIVPEIIATYRGNPPGVMILHPEDMYLPSLEIVSLCRRGIGSEDAAVWFGSYLQKIYAQGGIL